MNDDKAGAGKKGTRDLLGDLESIRTLLDEGEDSRSGDRSHRAGGEESRSGDRSHKAGGEESRSGDRSHRAGGDDEDVPLLEDVVHGGVSVNETFLAGEGDFGETADEPSALNEELFKALLSDEWRESARTLLDEARAAIERHQTEWTPRHTDELNQALKVRIDSTVQAWLRDVVQERIDELRRELLAAVADQIRVTIDRQFNQKTHEDPDGA